MKDKKGLKYKLQCVFYAVLIFSLIYGLMGKAKADNVDYSSEFWESVQTDLISYHCNDSYGSIYDAYISCCNDLGQVTAIEKYLRIPINNDAGCVYLFGGHDYVLYSVGDTFNSAFRDLTNYNYEVGPYSAYSGFSLISNDVDTRFFILVINYNSRCCFGCHRSQGTYYLNLNYPYSDYSSSDITSVYKKTSTNTNYMFFGNSSASVNINLFSPDIISKGVNIFIDNDQLALYYAESSIDWVSDDRLRLYTINTNVGKDLVVDLDDFDFTNQDGTDSATQNILSGGIVTLTIDYDGTSHDVVLDSSTSEFLPDMLIETPYSFFELGEYTTVQITGVSFSKIIHYRPSEMKEDEVEDYYISCSYYLKNDVSEIVPEEIPYDDNTNTPKITQVQFDEVMGKINFQDGHYSPLGGGGTPLVVPEGYDVMYVNITGSRTLSSIVNEIVYYNMIQMAMFLGPDVAAELTSYLMNEVWESVQGIQSTAAAEEYIYEHLRTNDYTQEFDIIVYYWAPDSSLGEVDCMYYYLTTCGRLRGINQTLADIWKECNQTAYNTSAIYDYMYDRLGNMINVSAEYFNKMAFSEDNLMGSLIGWNQSIYNKMDDVINAIKSIKLDSLDVTINGILTTSSLTSTLQYLFIPSYDGFQDTFEDSVDKLGILALPYTVTSDFISACKVPYQNNFSVTMPDYSLPMSENINGNVVSYDMPVWDEYTFSLDVGSVVGSDWLSFLQYCNALFVLVGVTLLTYKHIFVSSAQEESGVL